MINKKNTQSNLDNDNTSNKITYRKIIWEKLIFDQEERCTNALKLICEPEILKIAYNLIKSNPGNMTRGVGQETLDGINQTWFEKTAKELWLETYQPKPVRRVNIPKPNGKTRPLGISSPRDKIVQQALKLTLEAVLEPKFCERSHGFRPQKGCHSALKNIRNWTGVSWFIEGDISKFFDNIDHQLLSKLLGQHFREKKLENLYWKLVRAGYVEFDSNKEIYHASELGVPQGSIISPLLSNLVLNELDKFILKLIEKSSTESKNLKPYIVNPAHHALSSNIQNCQKKIDRWKKKNKDSSTIIAEKHELLKKRRSLKSTTHPENYSRIEYVRYADDWILGLWGSRKLALTLKSKIKEFLTTLHLELSDEKTLVTSARKGEAKFLGTLIRKSTPTKVVKVRRKGRIFSQRITSGNVWMGAPINELIKRLIEKGFLTIKGGRWIYRSRTNLLPLPDRDIITRYKASWNGIKNYYSFADNIYQLNKIHWILRESLRLTLSRKHQYCKSQFHRKYGKEIRVTFQRGKEKITTSFGKFMEKRNPTKFLNSPAGDPFKFLNMEVRTTGLFGSPCASCGSQERVEMHHIRHIRTINLNLSPFDKMMAKVNRKQVPLCHSCHKDVHAGRYSGKSLKHFSLN